MNPLQAIILAKAAGEDETAEALADEVADRAAASQPFDGLGEPGGEAAERNRQRMWAALAARPVAAPAGATSEDTTEGCVPNKTGKGYHDDRTGHPCTPKGGEGGKSSTGRAASAKAKPTDRPIANPAGKSYAGVKAEVAAVWGRLEEVPKGKHSVESASRNIGKIADAVRSKEISQDDGLELVTAQILGGTLRGGNYPVDSETVVNTRAGKVVVGVDAKNTRAVDAGGKYKADQITIKPDASENKAHWARQRAIDGRPGLALAFRFDPTQSYSVVVAATVRTASIGSGGELNRLGERAVATIPLCGEEAKKPCVSGLRDLGKPEVVRAVRAAIRKVAEEQDFGEWSEYLRSDGDRKRAKAADVVNSGMSDADKIKALMALLG